jgi:hypothetical protein
MLSTLVFPFDNLPDDLLREVFERLSEIDPPLTTQLGWITITHVCRRWRVIALGPGLSALWGKIVCTYVKPEVFNIILSRSGSAPLFLDFSSFPTSPHLSFDNLQVQHILYALTNAHLLHRVSSFVEGYTTHLFDDSLWFFSGKEFPVLRHLEVTTSYIRPTDHIRPMIAPALKKLCLGGFFFPIMSPSLRHLSLINAPRLVDEYVEMLSRIPLLEELHMEFSLLHSPAPNLAKPISLPQLKRISLTDTHDGCLTQLWAHLVIPSETIVSISISQEVPFTDTAESIAVLDAVLEAFQGHAFQASYDTFALSCNPNSGRITIALGTSSHIDTPSKPELFTLCIYCILFGSGTRAEVSLVLRRVAFHAVAHTRILAVPLSACSYKLEDLVQFIHVETIYVFSEDNDYEESPPTEPTKFDETLKRVLHLLQTLTQDQVSAAFPALHTVIFDESPPSHLLFAALNARFRDGATIQRLVLRGGVTFENDNELEADREALSDVAEVVGELLDERDVRSFPLNLI